MKPKILIAEDDEFLLQLLRMMLESEGWSAVGARDGAAALRAVRADRPDVCLIDVCMPQLDGWGVVRALDTAGGSGLPVAMMSAAGPRLDAPEDLKSRVGAYLQKPFALGTVIQVARMLVPLGLQRA
jgi:two-component system alkaline phosphatase synthesis response regulator PhoP